VIRRDPRKIPVGGNHAENLDYLDIPAFLRRQAD
jgi:3-deoxy-D-manno-octulosonic acid (KDO) 8-phosphate synthase